MINLFTAVVVMAAPVCDGMAKQFDFNERTYALIHDIRSRTVDDEVAAQARLAPLEEQRATAEGQLIAMGGIPRPTASYGPSPAVKVAEARGRLASVDAEYKTEGDRLTTLLTANKCKLPSHVTSWSSYSQNDPATTK